MSIYTQPLRRWMVVTQVLSLAVIVVLGVWLIRRPSEQSMPQAEKYPFLAKRLFAQNQNDIIINFVPMRSRIREYVAASPEHVGVYFEFLPTGVSVNVNGNDEFFRASLVKLPVVMRAYKFIEEGKLSLDDRLVIEEKQLDSGFGELWKRGAGVRISVRELVKLILSESDNTAFNVLYERVNVQLLRDRPEGDQSVDDVYDYLDIPRQMNGETPMITPKNYISVLKSLFFSAYLSYENSNAILAAMTGLDKENWLPYPIPKEVAVANKIGVYDAEPTTSQVYADCGIAYYPNRQYSLCVMVNSADYNKSTAHIRAISEIVYDYISGIQKE